MIFNISRTPIQITTYKNKNRESKFLNWLEVCKEKNKVNKISNIGGIQTVETPFHFVKDIFRKDIVNYLNSFKKKINFKYKVRATWVNENFYGDYNMPHTHDAPDCQFSGIWYLKCPPNSGRLVFLNQPTNADYPRLFDYIDDPVSWVNYSVVPQQYQLILFPASLVHLVEPSKSKDNRISVAFNISLLK